ncbi:hypothetical protein C0993_011259 [Termitomyces sp. T159_Od127]|nr:hypothetical protein C0993_011259 [Termitomyces sp. T159_Od127]
MTPWTFLVLAVIAAAQASNDWSKPCFSGVCSYDIPDSAGNSSGSFKIWGSSDAISDITVAAGWNIIDCSPDKLAQDIRLVCNSTDDNIDTGCSHLERGSGAAGKIVRLPENCGKNAFARVARVWVSDNQSIPDSIATKIVRRDDQRPQVKALTLDTNFTATDPSKTGRINFAVQGANVKGAAADIDISGVNHKRRRGIYSGENIERDLRDIVGDAINSIKDLDTFNFNNSQTLPPLNIDQDFNLLNAQLSCPPITASLTVDVDAKAHAVAAIGVAASGTIIPPNVEDFSVFIKLSGDINGTVTMKATASGTLDSGKLKLFEVGIPGLDFPGLLTIGPTFEVDAQASAGLDLQADTTVGLNYNLANAQLVFPPNSDQANNAGNAFTIGDTPLSISVSPSVQASGNVQAHLIPSLNLKVSALDDLVDVGIFLTLDASAEINLSLGASTTFKKREREQLRTIGHYMLRDAIAAVEVPDTTFAALDYVTSTTQSGAATSAAFFAANSYPSSVPSSSPSSAVSSLSSSSFAPSSLSSALSPAARSHKLRSAAPFGGCIKVDAGLSVNAGADGDFFGLFNANTKVPLFNHTFEILQTCFGNQKRSLAVASSLISTSLKTRAGLTCPVAGSSAPIKVFDQVVGANTIVTTA